MGFRPPLDEGIGLTCGLVIVIAIKFCHSVLPFEASCGSRAEPIDKSQIPRDWGVIVSGLAVTSLIALFNLLGMHLFHISYHSQ